MLKLWRQIGRDTRWVMTSYLLWGVGEGLWLYIQPLYVRSLGATSAETGFAMGMWGLARLLFILPVGVVSDRASAAGFSIGPTSRGFGRWPCAMSVGIGKCEWKSMT